MIFKARMAASCYKSFRSLPALGPSRRDALPQLCRASATKGAREGLYCGSRDNSAVRGARVASGIVLDLSRAPTEGFGQRYNRIWVHSSGEKQAVLSDMEEEKPVQENVDKCAEISPSKFLTLPNILTLGRVAAVPLLIAVFYLNGWWATTATTSIFVAAAATDWLDGYIARRMGSGSTFGAFLDPVADKLMVATTLVLLCTRPLEISWFGEAPWLLPVPAIAIIGRENFIALYNMDHSIMKSTNLPRGIHASERSQGLHSFLIFSPQTLITMSAVREWAAAQGGNLREAVAVNNLGKWKTASQMIALTILLATRDSSQSGASGVAACGVAMLYVAAGLGLWSLAVYMKGIWRILLR